MSNNSVLGNDDFLNSIRDTKVNKLTIGLYWILVEAEEGTGLVATPQNKISSKLAQKYEKKFKTISLYQLASLVKSENLIERAIGCAAINANTNHYKLKVTPENGLEP